jgi:hypothetical protein
MEGDDIAEAVTGVAILYFSLYIKAGKSDGKDERLDVQ